MVKVNAVNLGGKCFVNSEVGGNSDDVRSELYAVIKTATKRLALHFKDQIEEVKLEVRCIFFSPDSWEPIENNAENMPVPEGLE